VRLDVEPNQVRAEKAIEQFVLPGADPKHFGIGPWDMPKNRDPCVGPAALFDYSWKRCRKISRNGWAILPGIFRMFRVGEGSHQRLELRNHLHACEMFTGARHPSE